MDFSAFTDKQAECIRLLDRPLLVCAGAGSGKTFMLTQRIAWALSPGSGVDGRPFMDSIDQALVVTYTNKAAGELKDRIRSTLRAEGLASEALKVDGAWISTIHGMCDRILHEHAFELGLDPCFQLIMKTEAEKMRLEAINLTLQALEDKTLMQDYEALFDVFGSNSVADMLKSILTEASHLTKGLDAFDRGPDPTTLGSMARETLETLESASDAFSPKNVEKSQLATEAIKAFLADPDADPTQLVSALSSVRLAKQKNKPEVDDAIESLKNTVLCASLAAAYPLSGALMDLASIVDERYRNLLDERGLMDMSALIRITLHAFRENPSIAAEYTERFRLIMVDEFQDTSQLQIDMIECIAGTSKKHLCTVGDSQQSIYRFQGADVNVYLRHKQDMQSPSVDATTVKLEDNFRSHGDILAFVRKICGQNGFFPEDFLDLQHGRDEQRVMDRRCAYMGHAPRVETVLVTYPFRKAQRAGAEEARHIAQRFAELREAGHSGSQMVVLLGVMTHADVFAEALRAQGFSCVIAGGSGFYKTPEVALCRYLVQAIANPLDSQSLFAVLASDVLPVSSDDLLRLATFSDESNPLPRRQDIGRAFFEQGRAPNTRSPLLEHAFSVFSRAWRKLGFIRPSVIFLDAVIDSGWLQRLQDGGTQGMAQAANVLKFARLMEEAESHTGFDITRVALYMATLFDKESDKPGALSVEDDDAVRLMTIHASKGLEFPIVAIADCWDIKANKPGGTSNGSSCLMVCDRGTEYLSLRMPDTATPSSCTQDVRSIDPHASLAEYRSQLMQLDYDREYAEQHRLLYVAITRASEALILSMHRQANLAPKELQADVLAALFPGQEDFPSESCTVDYGGSQPMAFTRIDVVSDEDVEGDTSDDNDDTVPVLDGVTLHSIPQLQPETHLRLIPLSERADFFSYSSIAPHIPLDPCSAEQNEETVGRNEYEPDEADRMPSSISDADKATEFGSALHRACEWLALQPADRALDNDAVQAMLDRIGRAYAIKDTARLTSSLTRWRLSALCKKAFSFSTRQPEVPFCTVVDQQYLEGEIDLLCYDVPASAGGHAFIVDYKTGGSSAESPDALQAKHLLQAQCYAFAALRSGFQSVELHFVRVEREDPHQPDQPQIVNYSFEASDADTLKTAIISARLQHIITD